MKKQTMILLPEGKIVSNLKGANLTHSSSSKIILDLRKLIKLQLEDKRYELVKDLVVFQCYTGLEYTEMINLQMHQIMIDNRKLIGVIKRANGEIFPLLQRPILTINKYRRMMDNSEILFPQYSTAKYIQYVREICNLIHMFLSPYYTPDGTN